MEQLVLSKNDIELNRIQKIIEFHEELKNLMINSLEKAFTIGFLLKEQKEGMPHGEFIRWIEKNLPFEERTARNYMMVYKNKEMLNRKAVADLNSAYLFLQENRRQKRQTEVEEMIEKQREKVKYAKEHSEEIASEHPEGEIKYWKSRDGFKVKAILERYMNGLPLIRYECDDPGYIKIVKYKNSDVYKASLEFISYLESTIMNLKKIYKKYEDAICDDGKKNIYPEMENTLKSLKMILNQIMESKETKKIVEYESKEVIRTGWSVWGSEIEW